MFPTPTLEPYGPLTTLFNPPASCIFTTTVLGSEAFIGYHPDLGTDLACFPTSATPQDTALPVSSSTLATSTISSNNSTPKRGSTETTTAQTTGPTSSQILGLPSLLRYYSPGICPVGYSYNTPYSPPTDIAKPPSTTAYVCCPTGYNVKISYLSAGSYDTLWPLCTGYVTAITNAWRIIPGWPTIQPTPLELFTTTAGGPYDRFTPTASAIVVAWQSTDADILHYLDTARVYLPKPANYSLAYGKPHHHLSESGVIALCVVGFFILFFGISGACIYRARRAQTRAAQHPDGRESEPMQDNNGKRTRFRIIRRMPNPPQPFDGPLPVYSNMMLCGTGQSAASRGQPPDYDDAMKIADAQEKSLRADGSSP